MSQYLTGKYYCLTDKGKVPGIEGNYTDINILYKDKIKTKR